METKIKFVDYVLMAKAQGVGPTPIFELQLFLREKLMNKEDEIHEVILGGKIKYWDGIYLKYNKN